MYRKPELLLVGAAEGLVLGSVEIPNQLFKDTEDKGPHHRPGLSRNEE